MVIPQKVVMINKEREQAWRYWLAVTFDVYTIGDLIEDHISQYDNYLAKDIMHRVNIEDCSDQKASEFFKEFPFFNTDRIECCLFQSFLGDEMLDYGVGVV